MKKLKLIFVEQYRKQPSEKQRLANLPGTIVFVHKVTGDEKHINDYVESKKKDPKCNMKSIKKDDGTILYFGIRALKNPDGSVPDLMETSKGEWVPDTSKADMFKSLVDQYGYDIAQRMVQETAAQ